MHFLVYEQCGNGHQHPRLTETVWITKKNNTGYCYQNQQIEILASKQDKKKQTESVTLFSEMDFGVGVLLLVGWQLVLLCLCASQ